MPVNGLLVMNRGGAVDGAVAAARTASGTSHSCGCVTSARRRPRVGQHSSASASKLLGLDSFEVLAAQVVGGEWQLKVQTTSTLVGCIGCGVRAELHGRRTVRVRDLPAGGRPVVLCWRKCIWRCQEPACGVRTWTERGRTHDPLYRIRKLVLTAAEQLTGRGRARLRVGLAAGDPVVRWLRPGRVRSCSAPSMPRLARRRPAPPLSASTAGPTASRSLSRPAWLAPCGPGRPRSSPGMAPMAAPTARPRPSISGQEGQAGSGTASATSPTTACGCFCTAASGGRLTGPPACEAAPHT